ncbi:MAG: transposase [Solirubrobacterales bacterium]
MPRLHTRQRKRANTSYHVYSRGNAGQRVFNDRCDRREFIGLFKRYLSTVEHLRPNGKPYDSLIGRLTLIAYCLMPNHFHLVIHQIDRDALELLMRRVLTAYTKYFNNRHGRTGALFQHEYRSKPIHDVEQMKSTIAYVHDNHWEGPNHEFASHRYYVGSAADRPTWLDVGAGLAVFGGATAYATYMVRVDRQSVQMPLR